MGCAAGSATQQIQLRLHAGDRRAQLMRGVGDELLLRLHRGAQHREQAIERDHHRARFRAARKIPSMGRRSSGERSAISSRSLLTGRRPSWMPTHTSTSVTSSCTKSHSSVLMKPKRAAGSIRLPDIRHRDDDDAGAGVESRGQRAHAATLDLRHGEELRVHRCSSATTGSCASPTSSRPCVSRNAYLIDSGVGQGGFGVRIGGRARPGRP